MCVLVQVLVHVTDYVGQSLVLGIILHAQFFLIIHGVRDDNSAHQHGWS